MFYKITKRADIAEAFIPMNEIQEHLRTYDPHDEELLTVYREAAIDFAERYMNRAIGVHTVMASLPQYKSPVFLPFGDVKEVLSVMAGGREIPFTSNAISNQIALSKPVDDVVIEYRVGYETDDIPKAIKLGCMRIIANWFDQREDHVIGVSVSEMPFNHRACFDLYRLPAGG